MGKELESGGLDLPSNDRDYFTFAAQQVLFIRLCGGDPYTFQGGDSQIGERIVRNGQEIMDHYWKEKPETGP